MPKTSSPFEEAVERSEIIADALVLRLNAYHRCDFLVTAIQLQSLQTGVLMMLTSGVKLSTPEVEILATDEGRAFRLCSGIPGYRLVEVTLRSIRTGKAVTR